MDLRRVRRWQWAVLGIIAGLAMGAAQLLRGNDAMVGGEGFISQRVFEQIVKQSTPTSASRVVSLHIRPTPNVDMVTLNLSDKFLLGADQVRFASPRPYRPRGEGLPHPATPSATFSGPWPPVTRRSPRVTPGGPSRGGN